MTNNSKFLASNQKNQNNKSNIEHKTNSTVFYCPFCEHCNNKKNNVLEEHMRSLHEAKHIINRGLEIYILETQKINQNVDIFHDQFKAYEGSISVIIISPLFILNF